MSLFNIKVDFHGTLNVVDPEANRKLDCILSKLETMTMTLDDLKTKVTNQTTVAQSAVTLLQGLSQQIRDLKPNQQAIDELAASIDQSTQSLSDAVVANTPAE